MNHYDKDQDTNGVASIVCLYGHCCFYCVFTEFYYKHQLHKKLYRRDEIIFKESLLLGGTENHLLLDLEILEFSIIMRFPKDAPLPF